MASTMKNILLTLSLLATTAFAADPAKHVEAAGAAKIIAEGKVAISEALTKSKSWHAGNIVKALATDVNGGGGGQAFFATAGGTEVSGLDKALSRLDEYLK